MIKAEWTNKDSLDLQPTCNQLATTEGDLISRQAAIDALFSEPLYKSGMKKREADEVVPAIYEKIKVLPSAQPEIVRCKNCAWWQREWSDEKDYHYCTMEDDRTYKEFYCANAERREE